ncbi:hypothetical protein Tco_1051899 [Tanacetum coccineum]
MSALRRSDNENMLSMMHLTHMSILMDLKEYIKMVMEVDKIDLDGYWVGQWVRSYAKSSKEVNSTQSKVNRSQTLTMRTDPTIRLRREMDRLRFRHSSCPCIFRDCPFIRDVLLPMLEMDLLSFIRTADPTKVRIGESQRAEDEPKLMDITVGRVVPLLPVARARTEDGLDARPLQPKRQRKRKTIVSDSGGPSHPPKMFKRGHGNARAGPP